MPNGLFLSIAVAYALGAVRILRFGALVQQANAVESLSSVDVLCLDKTGTLTANRLQVAGLRPLAGGEQDLQRALGVMVASATTHTKTSAAIAGSFAAAPRPAPGRGAVLLGAQVERRGLHRPATGHRGGWRGAWPLCPRRAGGPPAVPGCGGRAGCGGPAGAHHADPRLDRPGLRVLLLASHPDPTLLEDRGDASRLPDGLTPLGLVALSDELRPEARDTLARFMAAGVSPKIISGDNPDTVAALARQAGLTPESAPVSGPELAQMSPTAFAQAAEEATIFGRITPQQKEQLITALRARGHYVAMIGDGVNDVLSLKKANLGIALQSGSQATRAVADIVLVNDSFAALAPAVIEGQRILTGMQDILKLFLARITTIALVIVSALVVGTFPSQCAIARSSRC